MAGEQQLIPTVSELGQREHLQLSLDQRFSLRPQNAIDAPLVTQIHSHRQTIQVGTKTNHRRYHLLQWALARRTFG